MKRIIPKYIIRSGLYFQKVLVRLLTYPIHFGSHDYYPPLHYLPSPLPLARRISFSASTRLKYWNTVAKIYEPFQPFYKVWTKESYLDSVGITKESNYYVNFCELYENGCTVIDNFLGEDDHFLVKKAFESTVDPKLGSNSIMVGVPVKEDKLNALLHRNISIFEKVIFGKYIRQQKYILSALLVKNGKSPFKESQKWHIDRFIPCFKMFYYPNPVETNPLEYYEGSHLIDEQYLKNALLGASKDISNINTDEDYDFSNYRKRTFYVKGNSLVIAATNGFHRRLNEDKNGVRKFITFHYYFAFTRFDLLKNYIFHKFQKNNEG